MVYSAQQSAVTPMGIKKKKTRFAPIIQEQARQGIATKMVVAGKEREQQQQEFAFEKQKHQESLAMQTQQFAEQKKARKAQTIVSGISTAAQIASLFF